MKIKKIAVILRKDHHFHLEDGRKIPAVYPNEGYAVMVFLENSPIDKDFEDNVWVPSSDEIMRILQLMKESDEHTYKMLGHGWNGKRPYWKLQDFM